MKQSLDLCLIKIPIVSFLTDFKCAEKKFRLNFKQKKAIHQVEKNFISVFGFFAVFAIFAPWREKEKRKSRKVRQAAKQMLVISKYFFLSLLR
jgi:hypothetical protein